VTVMVPNSLGPAELLLHYGSDAQKAYYLPRLARGEEFRHGLACAGQSFARARYDRDGHLERLEQLFYALVPAAQTHRSEVP